jgi:hypothetical protein
MQTAAWIFPAKFVQKQDAQKEKDPLKKGLSGMCTILRVTKNMGPSE